MATTSGQLRRRISSRIVATRDKVNASEAQLRALSPAATLSRGYAIARVDGRIVFDASTVESGSPMVVQLHRGRLNSTVESIEPET
jgi:exodeoxyribonuclease VII large subunit